MPELRKDPISGRWVIFSPDRLRRPSAYQWVARATEHAEDNPFLSGHEQYTPNEVFAFREPGTQPNKPGWRVRVVPNRFPALKIEGELEKEAVGFYDRMNGIGAHEVIVETPRADEALEQQPLSGIVEVLSAYRSRMLDLSKDSRFRYIQIFKNVGPLAGATLPHSHSQIIALPVTPIAIKERLNAAKDYYELKDRNLFEDILRNERNSGDRMVYENAGFAAFCPFASRVPFEICILPRRQSAYFPQTADHDLVLLADTLKRTLAAYRFGLNVPDYNLIFISAPLRKPRRNAAPTIDQDFRWHIEILPRISGFAGFELATGFHINPTLPEEAARFLREVKTDV